MTGPVFFQPTPNDLIHVAGFPVTLKASAASQTTKTDLFGRYRFRNVAPGTYTVCWEEVGWRSGCTPEFAVTAGDAAHPGAVELEPSTPEGVVWGSVGLADGTSAVHIDGGSATEEAPSVELLDATGKSVGAGRTNAEGRYAIGVSAAAATLRVSVGAERHESSLIAEGTAAGGMHVRLSNRRPVIAGIEVLKAGETVTAVHPGDTLTLRPTVTDPEGDPLSHRWSAGAGTISGAADGSATWELPDFPARLSAYLLVADEKGGADNRKLTVRVGAPQANATFEAVGAPQQCSPLSLGRTPPPAGYPPSPLFLSFMGTTDHSADYYQHVDPESERMTLGDWWKNAGFNPDGSGGVVQAAYLNWNDLGFGRDMHFNKVGDNVYAWVTNYGCPDDHAQNANLAERPMPAEAVATVCMEYSPVEGNTQPIVKFFVYAGGQAAGTRLGMADLDEWGPKPVPNLCQNCHGGPTPYSGGPNVDLGASFLPFDLALLRYPGPLTTPPDTELEKYHMMNSIIHDYTNPTAAISNLINGWYTPLNAPPTQNNEYLPAAWQASNTVPQSAADLYQNVIVPGCRACHYSLSSDVDWDSYQSVLESRSAIQRYACTSKPFMPHAAVTYLNFWNNAAGAAVAPATFLGQYSDPGWQPFGECLPPVPPYVRVQAPNAHYQYSPNDCPRVCKANGYEMANVMDMWHYAEAGLDDCAYAWVLDDENSGRVASAFPMYSNQPDSSGCGPMNTGNTPRLVNLVRNQSPDQICDNPSGAAKPGCADCGCVRPKQGPG